MLAGCGGADDTAAPTASAETTESPAAPVEPSASPTPDASTGTGCAATDAGTPEGAATTEIVDVDGDDLPDLAWMTAGAGRTFGVTTASGATFSAPVESASPVAASAVVNVVGDDATPVALVDLGRQAQLYTLTDCAVTQTADAAGEPYVFDRGFGDQGTGVGCTDVDGVLHVAGLLATEEGGGWTVTRTLVDLTDAGKVATNGTVEVVAEDAAATDAVVTTAQEVSCGDLVAGDDGLAEPVQ